MADGLRNLQFRENSSNNSFIKFQAEKPLKLRVYTTNPLISKDKYGNTKYSFSVWNYEEGRAMVLSKGTSIAKPLAQLHKDEDYGADITKQDIKITPTGEELERRYTINVLPKAQQLDEKAIQDLASLDGNLEKIIENGIRADQFNEGAELPEPEEYLADEDER